MAISIDTTLQYDGPRGAATIHFINAKLASFSAANFFRALGRRLPDVCIRHAAHYFSLLTAFDFSPFSRFSVFGYLLYAVFTISYFHATFR